MRFFDELYGAAYGSGRSCPNGGVLKDGLRRSYVISELIRFMSMDSLTACARRPYSASIENSVTSGSGRLWVSAVELRSRRRISGESKSPWT